MKRRQIADSGAKTRAMTGKIIKACLCFPANLFFFLFSIRFYTFHSSIIFFYTLYFQHSFFSIAILLFVFLVIR